LYQSDNEVRSAKVRSLQRWWRENARDGIPDRANFQPFEFTQLLPYLLIADVEHDPFRIRYRLVGTKVVEATGLNLTGLYLDELDPTVEDEPWMDNYALAHKSQQPVLGTTTVKTTSGLRFVYEFGIFPLSKGGTRVDQCVAIEDYFEFAHLFRELEDWRALGSVDSDVARQLSNAKDLRDIRLRDGVPRNASDG
jgi:hypothetical protein